MKKITAFILSAAMLMPCIPTNAAEPSLDFLNYTYTDERYSDVCENLTLSFSLNEPLQIFDTTADEITSNYINLPELVSSVFGSTITMNTNQIYKNDTLKLSANLKANSPITINKNLSLGVDQNYDIYMDMDLSDKENPDLSYIMAMPFSDKYLTMDTASTESLPGVNTQINPELLSEDVMSELMQKYVDSISKNATVSGDDKNVTITFSDMGLKMFIADIFSMSKDFTNEETKEQFELFYNEEDFTEFVKNITAVPIFDNDALVLKCELNKNKTIAKTEFTLNVNFSLYDLLVRFGLENDEVTKENSKINFTVSGASDISYGKADVVFPTLTEENSITLEEFSDPYGYNTPESEYAEPEEYYWPYLYINIDSNFTKSINKYVQLRSLLEESGYSVSYDHGTITAQSVSKFSEYDTITLKIGSDSIVADGVNLKLNTAPALIGGTSYISLSDALTLSNSVFTDIHYSVIDNSGEISLERQSLESDFE